MGLLLCGHCSPHSRRPMEVCAVLSAPDSPYECPRCAVLSASRRSLDSHLRLDHVADEDRSLTVADILSTSREEPPAVPRPVEQRRASHRRPELKRAQILIAQSLVVAPLACMVMLYGLTHVDFGVGGLLRLWVLVVVVGAALALAAWACARLRQNADIRRQQGPWY